MPNYSQNVNIKLPNGNETVTRAIYNENMEIIDGAFGTIAQEIEASQGQLNDFESQIESVGNDVETINQRLDREHWSRKRGYDSLGRMSTVTFTAAGVTKATLTYSYDALGRIGSRVLAVVGAETITETETYDAVGRRDETVVTKA